MPKNITFLPYLYRDASNFKTGGSIYLNGKLSPKQIQAIREKLHDGDQFIPGDLNLDIREVQSDLTSFPSEDDHVYHELQLDAIGFMEKIPEGETLIEIDAFMGAFAAIPDSNAWNESDAIDRVGLCRPRWPGPFCNDFV